MKRISILLLAALCATLAIAPLLSSAPVTQTKKQKKGQPLISSIPTITLAPLTTIPGSPSPADPISQLTAIEYQEVGDRILVSLNAPSGTPYNFEQVFRNGTHSQFSSNSGFPEEVHIAVASSLNCTGTGLSLGGFQVGDVFVGSGFGLVSKISADGSTTTPFATLPGETGLLWGGVAFDKAGTFGGDLICTTTSGGVYRVNSAGVGTLIVRIPGGGVKGCIVIPNDPRFGPIAGKILVGGTPTIEPSGAPDNGYVVDAAGNFELLDLGIYEIEGLRIVPPGGDFFATDVPTHTVFTAPASQFAGIVGDLVIASEIDFNTGTGRLFDIIFTGVGSPGALPNGFLVREIPGGRIGQYEGIAFSCLGAPCVPSTLTCPASTCINAAGPTVVTFPTPVTTGGTNPGSTAVCTPPSGSVFALGTTPVSCTASDGCTGTASCSFNVTLASCIVTLTDFTGNGTTVTINLCTGAYTFTCGDRTTMSGIGHITIRGGIITLDDVCVLVTIDCASGRATGTLKMPMGTVKCSILARGVVCPLCQT